MENVIKYPVKYGVLEIPNSTFGFIVSKCYVIEDVTKYYSNGDKQEYHKVVFPYPSIDNYKKKREYDADTKALGIRNNPKYDMFNMICNDCVVRKVFDTFSEAYGYATVKNKDLINSLYEKIPSSYSESDKKREREKLSLRFQLDTAICERFEKLILENTTDMEVENEKDDPLKESFEGQKQLTRIYVNSVRGCL